MFTHRNKQAYFQRTRNLPWLNKNYVQACINMFVLKSAHTKLKPLHLLILQFKLKNNYLRCSNQMQSSSHLHAFDPFPEVQKHTCYIIYSLPFCAESQMYSVRCYTVDCYSVALYIPTSILSCGTILQDLHWSPNFPLQQTGQFCNSFH